MWEKARLRTALEWPPSPSRATPRGTALLGRAVAQAERATARERCGRLSSHQPLVQGGSPELPKTFHTSSEETTSPSWWGMVNPPHSQQTATLRVKAVTGDVLRVVLLEMFSGWFCRPAPDHHAAQEWQRFGVHCHNTRGSSPSPSSSHQPGAGLTSAAPLAGALQPRLQMCLSFICLGHQHPFLGKKQ